MAVVDRWSLFRCHLCNKKSIGDLKIVAVIDRWLLFRGGRYSSGLNVYTFVMSLNEIQGPRVILKMYD